MLLGFIISLLIPTSYAATMQPVDGYIVNIVTCNLEQLSYNDCTNQCLSLGGCMIAYIEYNNQQCFLCPYGTIHTVLKDSNNIANFSIKYDSCDSSSTYEDGTSIYGHVTTRNKNQYYGMDYSAGSWTMSYTGTVSTDNGCPNRSWKRFARAQGAWCVGGYYSTDGTLYNWNGANQQCQKMGAVLSGTQNTDEISFINQTIMTQWTADNFGVVWIGAKRKAACTLPNWDYSICNNSLTVFEWTDGFTTGTDGFLWLSGRPDGAISPTTGEQQSCMMMYSSGHKDCHKWFFEYNFFKS